MVRQCQVCGKLGTFHPGLSFHRFPTNPERRKIWFALLGFEENRRMPKHADICSAHFDKNDLHFRDNGFKYLNKNANPLQSHPEIFEFENFSSDSTVTDTPPRKCQNPLTDIYEDLVPASVPVKIENEPQNDDIVITGGSTASMIYNKINKQVCLPGPSQNVSHSTTKFDVMKHITSPDTNTASETEESIIKLIQDETRDIPERVVEPQSGYRGKLSLLSVPKKRFPVDHDRKMLWFSIVGFTKDQRLPKHPEICSDHFDPGDLIMKQNGLRYIKPGATPKPKEFSQSEESSACSSDATIYETPPRTSKEEVQEIFFEDLIASPVESREPTSIAGPSTLAKKSGTVCSCKGCPNKSYNSREKFYTFPRDVERAKTWLEACNRQDLLGKVEVLHKTNRICGSHFRSDMFSSNKRKLLISSAIPTIFPPLPGTSSNIAPSTSGLTLMEKDGKFFSISDSSESDRRTIKDLEEENRKLEEENEMLLKQYKDLQLRLENAPNEITLEQYKALTYKFCPSKEIAELINIQISQTRKSTTRNRTQTNEFKFKCLSLYFSTPKLYKNTLANIFHLPDPQALQKLFKRIDISPGFGNPDILKSLKLKVINFDELNRFCVLCVGEKSIKSNLFYNSGGDNIIGLADNGKEDRDFKAAKTSTVLMVRGIFSDWAQPLGYIFSHTTCPGAELKEIVFNSITKLKQIGLNVIVLSSEMGSNYTQLQKLLKVSPETPYFFVMDQKVHFLFDTARLLKALRNVLMKYNFIVNENTISWTYIKQFYNDDKGYSRRAAPKLTDSHIFPNKFERTEVKYASQVFSATVAVAISVYMRFGAMPQEAESTSRFIDKIDKLFDIMNSRKSWGNKKFNLGFKGLDHQVNFLNECLELFQSLKVVDTQGVDVTNKVKFINGFKISINSLLDLWPFLASKKLPCLFTRRLSQDCLENCFAVRQQNGTYLNPTPLQFKRSFKNLFFERLLNSGTEHCEGDSNLVLFKLIEAVKEREVLPPIILSGETDLMHVETDYHTNELLNTHFVRYLPEYLLKKCLKIHSCNICEGYSKAHENMDENSYFLISYYRVYYQDSNLDTSDNLNMLDNDFIEYISLLEVFFQMNFESLASQGNIIKNFMDLCKDKTCSHPCENFPKFYLIQLFARVRLFYTLKSINKHFRTNQTNEGIMWKNK